MQATWYFDVISPFAYLQSCRLSVLNGKVDVTLKPVLFAGLLNAHGQKGPAEIPPKKLFTYRYVTWAAAKRGVPFTFPDAHPFNPIRALRLIIALGCTPDVVHKVFHAVWGEGHLPDNDAGWEAIQTACEVADGDALISDPTVKQTLIQNGEDALSENVFGVPSFVMNGEVFWGDDALDFVLDYLAAPTLFEQPDMAKLNDLPSSSVRKL